jgi:hypothetical protein
MEEISWGQRVFGLDTPEFLASSDFNRLFYASGFLASVAIPSLAVFSSRFNSMVGRQGIPLP